MQTWPSVVDHLRVASCRILKLSVVSFLWRNEKDAFASEMSLQPTEIFQSNWNSMLDKETELPQYPELVERHVR